ncbi:metallophosphoesterase [Nocardia salmonicida]|uniref:metallophosphoesterase n=1 Tax=Nocardia salmonicida TaxID=53431 RepID=UPI00369CBD15
MTSVLLVIVVLLVPAVMFAVPWWTLVAAPTGRSGTLFRVGTAACVVGYLCLLAALFLGHGPPQFDPAAIVGDVLLGVLWVVFVWSVIGSIVRGTLRVAGVDRTRASRGVALAVVVVSAVLTGYGVYEARRVPQVRTVDIAIPGLADGLDGLRVVVLTDTHFAAIDREEWSRDVVDVVNAQRPAIVGLAGDLVDGSVAKRADQVAPLAGVEAPLGRFYITGNHEYLDDAQSWIDYMASIGWQPCTTRTAPSSAPVTGWLSPESTTPPPMCPATVPTCPPRSRAPTPSCRSSCWPTSPNRSPTAPRPGWNYRSPGTRTAVRSGRSTTWSGSTSRWSRD